jgi:hypothetical protein
LPPAVCRVWRPQTTVVPVIGADYA